MPTAIHARRRLLAAAGPQMSRMNVGHRPAIHSPHGYPPRTTGFGRPRRPLRAARPIDPPQTRPRRPTCRRVTAIGISFRQGPCGALPGAVLERVCRRTAASPRGLTHAILNTGHWANQRPHRSDAAASSPGLPVESTGGRHPGPGSVCAMDRKSGSEARRGGLPLICQPLWRLRPSDAAWKQRLGLVTLFCCRHGAGRVSTGAPVVAGCAPTSRGCPAATLETFQSLIRNDIVVFRPFCLSFPSYTWQGTRGARAARKCWGPQLFFARASFGDGLHKSPRFHTSLPRLRVRDVDMAV